MGPTRSVLLASGLTFALGVGDAAAETFRLTGPDGTLHVTNAPSDPRYQRMGFVSGSQAGFLRLPEGNTGPFLQEIRDAAERHGVPVTLVSAVIRAESGFNPRAVSRRGAQGLMQLMPATASMLGVRNSFDPRQNIDGGVRHLRSLIDRFADSLPLALAAYNAGEGAVLQYRGIPPFAETREYVTRVMSFYGGPAEAAIPPPPRIYRLVAPDGTETYTNVPPRGQH